MISLTALDELPTREGHILEKGVVLTSDFLNKNADLVHQYLNFWMLYPDLFLDFISLTGDNFKLKPYQRVELRAIMRYRYNSWTATRATSKSFTAYLGAFLLCMFRENSKIALVSDTKGTVIKSANEKFSEIFEHWPLLRNELKNRADDGVKGERSGGDYFEFKFKNGSTLAVISIDKRGLRLTGCVVEEAATVDEVDYNEVVVPTMNVPRRDAAGNTNPDEPNPVQIFITSAGPKACFFYGKLIELAQMSVLRPKEYFVWGSTYHVPVYYGLLNEDFIKEQKYSDSYSAEAFQRESMSVWTGANSDAWFDEQTLIRRRTLLTCETTANIKKTEPNAWYQIGVDVGRYKCNTAIVVCKVIPSQKGFKKKIVYLEVINGQNFITEQAPRIKQLIRIYNPREVIMDGNGLGCGLLDAMAIPSYNAKTGETYPAYFVFNNDEHLPVGKKAASANGLPWPELNAIIYDMKANNSNDSAVHANIYSQFANGSVSLLVNERVAKQKLMKTERGRKMSPFDVRKFLLPYEMTSRLIDEILNLRLKASGGMGNQTKVEQINGGIAKDRFSALEYVLWRVKFYEDEAARKLKRNGSIKDMSNLFSSKKKGDSYGRKATRQSQRGRIW